MVDEEVTSRQVRSSSRFQLKRSGVFLFLLFFVILISSYFAFRLGCGRTYTVRSGDTMSGIAALCGVSLTDLQQANPQIASPDQLVPNQALTIPNSTNQLATFPTAAIPVTGGQTQINCSPDSGVAGSQVTVTGAGFPKNTVLNIMMSQVGLASSLGTSATTNDDGTFSQQVKIPNSAIQGSVWQISAMDPNGGSSASAQFQVLPVNSPGSNRVALPPGTVTYTVKPGDTLSGIASLFNITVDELVKANPGFTDDRSIFAGQQLVIPDAVLIPVTGTPATITLNPEVGRAGSQVAVTGTGFNPNSTVNVSVGQGSSIAGTLAVTTAEHGNFSANVIIPAGASPASVWTVTAVTPGGGPSVKANFQVSAPASSGLYTIVAGDTMRGIAARFDTTVDALIRANTHLTSDALLRTGQQLFTPGTTVTLNGQIIYVLTSGDYLSMIAANRNLKLAALVQANPSIPDPDLVYPGDHVIIP